MRPCFALLGYEHVRTHSIPNLSSNRMRTSSLRHSARYFPAADVANFTPSSLTMHTLAFLSLTPLRPVHRMINPVHPRIRKTTTMVLRSDDIYMRQAILQAELARAKGEVPIGAVLIDSSGSVISKGHNLVESLNDCTRHAEMICLQSAMAHRSAWRLTDTILYSTLEPCPMCLSAIALARVKRLVYGAPDLRLGACGTYVDLVNRQHPFHNFDDVTGGVLEDECANMMKQFFRERRKDPPRYTKVLKSRENGVSTASSSEDTTEGDPRLPETKDP